MMDDNKEIELDNQKITGDRLFRTAVLGFNREDVTAYLARIARERRKESERYASALRTLEGSEASGTTIDAEKLSEKERNIRDSENAALRSENNLLKLRIQELEKAQATTKVEDVSEEAVTTDKAVSVSTATEQLAQLKALLEQSEFDKMLLQDKLRAFELDKAKASTVVEDARDKAHQMEAEAADQADQLVRDAQLRIKRLDSQLSELEESVELASRQYFDRLFANRERFDELKACTTELRRMIAAFRL